jgi:ABC-type lipoprotein export system ATPase subunit
VKEAVVELRDVFCVHRTNEGDAAALQGTNLELGRGEVLGVLGPSGAGKSTLLRVIAGVQPPSAGIVRVLGRDVGRMPARSRSRFRHELVGFLGQDTEAALSPDLRIRDAIGLALALRGRPRGEHPDRVDELLEVAGLADRAGAFPAELSGGERQRAALCAAVAHKPALLLADEPTAELDTTATVALLGDLTEVLRAQGTAAVIVTHDTLVEKYVDRVVMIRDGRTSSERRWIERGGEMVNDELAIMDRAGRLQLPQAYIARLGLSGRVRLHLEDDRIVIIPGGDDGE